MDPKRQHVYNGRVMGELERTVGGVLDAQREGRGIV